MPNTPPQLQANGNIRPSRFLQVDATASMHCIEGTANCDVIGISQPGSREAPIPSVTTVYAAQAGENIQILGQGDITHIEAGGAITAGNRLRSDAQGRGVAIATTGTTIQKIGAMALEDAAAAGELIRVQVQIYSERPALV